MKISYLWLTLVLLASPTWPIMMRFSICFTTKTCASSS